MRINKLGLLGFLAGIMSFAFVLEGRADCQIHDSWVGHFYGRMFASSPAPVTTLKLSIPDIADKKADMTLSRAGHGQAISWSVNIEHSLFPTDGAAAETAAFKGILLPSEATQNAVNLIDTGIRAFAYGHDLERINLGKAGAIALIPEAAFRECARNPAVYYIAPTSSATVTDMVKERFFYIPDEPWDRLVAAILRLNSGNRLTGDRMEEVLDKSGDRTAETIRTGAVYSSIAVSVLSKVPFGEKDDEAVILPTIPDLDSYVLRLSGDPANIEAQEYSAKIGAYYNEKSALEARLREGTLSTQEIDAQLEERLKQIRALILETDALIEFISENQKKAQEQARRFPEDPIYSVNVGLLIRKAPPPWQHRKTLEYDYEILYGMLRKAPSLVLGPNFERTTIANAHYRHEGLPCQLTVQRFDLPDSSIPLDGQSLKLSGEIFFTYSPAKDPISGKELVRVRVISAARMPNLNHVHRNAVRAKIPPSSCEDRYGDMGGYTQVAAEKSLVGISKVRYERWECGDFFWICFKDWEPRECKKAFKTRILRTQRDVRFSVSPWFTEGGDVDLYIQSSFSSRNQSVPLDTIFGKSDTLKALSKLINLEWTGIGFSLDPANDKKPLLVLDGRSRLVRPPNACAWHKVIGKLVQ